MATILTFSKGSFQPDTPLPSLSCTFLKPKHSPLGLTVGWLGRRGRPGNQKLPSVNCYSFLQVLRWG